MLSKESKIRVLENFYAIDYVLFGKPVTKVQNCCPIIKEEYIQIKGAMLSVFIEMLKLLDHSPKPLTEKVTQKVLKEMARDSAKSSRYAAKKIVTTEKSKADIKFELNQILNEDNKSNITKIVERKITEKAFRLAIDNLLVARALNEANDLSEMNQWTGKIIEDSYKILRDNLCETAMMIIYDGDTE